MYKKVIIKPQREASLERFHPWIFSGSILRADNGVEDGELVYLENTKGVKLALGHYFQGSIAIRILSFEPQKSIDNIFIEKINAAFVLRKNLGLINNPLTNIYRLIHGEGDGLPGLIIDVYGHTLVVQCHTIGMYRQLDLIISILISLYGKDIHIYDKSSDVIKDILSKGSIYGQSREEVYIENGYKFHIDWEKGQKTGFFIDQRNNRKALQAFVEGKNVVNLFSYSGGFSVYARAAGASNIISVDASASANEICRQNFLLNFNETHEAITADAMDYLKDMSKEFDIVVLDPPAFAKHLSAKHKAIQGYKRINAQALKHIKSKGILVTFSCSQVIDAALFKDTIVAAGIEAKRQVKIIQQLSQPEDHPINLFHPESNYLKGLVLYVE